MEINMTIKTNIESAQESVRKALVNALENKTDYLLTDLFESLNKLNNISSRCHSDSFCTDGLTFSTSGIKTSGTDVLTFSTSGIKTVPSNQSYWEDDGFSMTGNPSSYSPDTISFG